MCFPDYIDYLHSEAALSASKFIRETTPSFDIADSLDFITDQAIKSIKQNSISTSKALNDPILEIMKQHHYNIAQLPYFQDMQKELDFPSFNIAKQVANIITQAYKSTITDLSEYDFRIGVASQELEQTFVEKPEGITEKLLFKDISEPSNELESQLFDILNQQREILNDHSDILKEIQNSQSENIANKQSDKKHDSPTFYKDKMWYSEQIGAALIGMVVNEIVNITIGVDSHNTILLVLFLRCFLQFLK